MPDAATVSNSSCLIALDAIDRFDLLHHLYGNIIIPDAVANECGLSFPAWVDIQAVQNMGMVQSLRLQLGAGESEAIALATELSAARLILDDKKGRRIARQMGLPITGTVAILIQAKQRGLITKVVDVLNQLVATGFFVAKPLADEARRLAGE